jgi:hypothetical protein
MKNVIPEPITDLLILFATNLFKIDFGKYLNFNFELGCLNSDAINNT